MSLFNNIHVADLPNSIIQFPLLFDYGQKATPLTQLEITMISDLNYAPWRELYIDLLCSEMVIAGVTSGFPLIGDHFLINQSKTDVEYLFDESRAYHNTAYGYPFENSSLIDKFKLSEEIKAIHHTDVFKKLMQISDSPISNCIHNIQRRIEAHLQMSNFTLVKNMSHMGYNIHTFILDPEIRNDQIARAIIHNIADNFDSFVFEIAYNLICLHEIAGVIHGDLHLDNILASNSFTAAFDVKYTTCAQVINNPFDNYYTAYHINLPKFKGTYIYQYYGAHSVIIDFSRSLITKKNNDPIFIENQKLRIKSILKNTINYTDIPIDDLPTTYELLKIIDFYALFQSLDVLVTKNTTLGIDTSFSGIKFQLKTIIDKYILSGGDLLPAYEVILNYFNKKGKLPPGGKIINFRSTMPIKHIPLMNPQVDLPLGEPLLVS